ncbi:hypothetical protein Bbelb_069850 [Branchiostoma belcheri]|nr:hypothetical protein Bbelb_069850 [Branchiostoma belcheri]
MSITGFLVILVLAVQLVYATRILNIQEGNGTAVLSVTAQPGVLRWNSSTEDAFYTCETVVDPNNISVRFLSVDWSSEDHQRSDFGDRWEETESTNWQGQQLTKTVTLRLRNAVPEDAGTYNCSVSYQPSAVSSSYHVWTTARLEVDQGLPAKGGILQPVLFVVLGIAVLTMMFNLIWCFVKMKAESRVRDGSELEPDKKRKTPRAPMKRQNSISPSSLQSLPQLNAVPSISIIEAGVQESQIDAIEQHLQQLDDITEDHEEVSVRAKENNGGKVQEVLVHSADVTTTYVRAPVPELERLKARGDRGRVSSIADDQRDRLDADDQRAWSSGSQRSNASSGYGSMPSTPRPRRTVIPPKNTHSPQVKQNTWVNPDGETGGELDVDKHQDNAQNSETTTSLPQEDNAADEDRQRDLQLYQFSMDRYSSFITNIREENTPLSIQLHRNFSSTNFAVGVFDQGGGHLSLPYHDVNLFIPPGAIEVGQLKTIHIFVPPSMNHGKPAPIVHCGPTGTTFRDHVVLTFPVDPKYKKIIPKFTNTEVGSLEEWQPLIEDDDAASIVQNGKCTLFLYHFTGFGAEATEETSSDKKIIRVGAFASKHTRYDDVYQMRIRIYDASADACQRIYGKERNEFTGGRLRDDDKKMHVDKLGGALCVKMSAIARSWKAMEDSDENQRIEVGQIWDGSEDTDACCTIRLEKVNPSAPVTSVWSTVSVWQEEAHGQTVTLKPSDTIEMSPRGDTPSVAISPTQAFLHRELEDDMPRPSSRPLPILPYEIRHEMCVLLDVENPLGNDWRRLAEKMGFNPNQVRWLNERFKSPTKTLLDDWETRNVSGGIVALQRLCDLFEEIKRPDVKALVEKVLSSGGLRDSGYGNSVSTSSSRQATPNGSQATLNQSVVSESFVEPTSAKVVINSNMPVTDV